MALTPEQTAAVEKIMAEYRQELARILAQHRTEIEAAVERIDKQKSQEIHRIITSL